MRIANCVSEERASLRIGNDVVWHPGCDCSPWAMKVIRPNPSWPELRLRITPPQGLIYAPSNSSDRNLTQ